MFPEFLDNWHTKVVRFSALRTGRLYHQEISLALIYFTGWVETTSTVQPEGLSEWNIPTIPSGIEPATFPLVMQCLNLLHHRLPPSSNKSPYISDFRCSTKNSKTYLFQRCKDSVMRLLDRSIMTSWLFHTLVTLIRSLLFLNTTTIDSRIT